MPEPRESERESPKRATEPSGASSLDRPFEPAELFDVVERDENLSRVAQAMGRFLRHDDGAMFERAVAVYVRSARERGEPIEGVLRALGEIADITEGAQPMGFEQRDTPLRQQILRGVLLAFYGANAVHRESAAREERVEKRRAREERYEGEERRAPEERSRPA